MLDRGSNNIWKHIFKFPLKHLENKIRTEPQPEKAKLLYWIRKAKPFYLVLDRGSNNIWKCVFKFPLKHLENKISTEPQPKKASKLLCCIRKAKLFYLMLDSTIINVSFRIFFVRKIKGWSSPFSLNNTNWNAFKQVINNYTIYYWSQVITSSTLKSWHKKKNSISIPYRTSTKLSSLNFSKKTTTTTNTGISNWDLSHCKNTNKIV